MIEQYNSAYESHQGYSLQNRELIERFLAINSDAVLQAFDKDIHDLTEALK